MTSAALRKNIIQFTGSAGTYWDNGDIVPSAMVTSHQVLTEFHSFDPKYFPLYCSDESNLTMIFSTVSSSRQLFRLAWSIFFCSSKMSLLTLQNQPYYLLFKRIKPPFSWSIHIISRLIIHLTATYNYSKMYLILWNVAIYSSSFSGYDLKCKKRQNNALKTWLKL